jgi:hypothetical protein
VISVDGLTFTVEEVESNRMKTLAVHVQDSGDDAGDQQEPDSVDSLKDDPAKGEDR